MTSFYGLNSQNYSLLFQNSGNSKASAGLGLYSTLSEFGFIQKGTYKKLCNYYYAKEENSKPNAASSSSSTKKDSAVAEATVDLKKSVSAFSKMEYAKENASKIEEGVTDFVKSYNNMVSLAEDSEVNGVKAAANCLTSYVKANANSLKRVGITVGSNNKLSISKDALSKASASEVKSLFKGSCSFGGRVSSYATSLYTSSVASKSSLYTNKGTVNALNVSSLYNAFL